MSFQKVVFFLRDKFDVFINELIRFNILNPEIGFLHLDIQLTLSLIQKVHRLYQMNSPTLLANLDHNQESGRLL